MLTGALAFSFADAYPQQIKQFLSKQLKTQLEFDQFVTTWDRGNPVFRITNLKVINADGDVKAAFNDLSGHSYGYSWLYWWPKFFNVIIESPSVVIESLSGGGIKVAGVLIQPSQNKRESSFPSLLWLLNQEQASLSNGNVVWQHTDGSTTQFTNIAAKFLRQGDSRQFTAHLDNDNGVFGVDFDVEGNVLSKDGWSAKMNMFSGDQTTSVDSRNIQLSVANGKGEVNIPELYAERAMDIVRMVGVGSSIERQLLETDFKGLLKDIRLEFSGPLIDLEDWSVTASGHNLRWNSSQSLPGLDSVDAELSIDKEGGFLDFTIENAKFNWPAQFLQPFDIDSAKGRLSLRFDHNSTHLKLLDANLQNEDIQLDDIELSLDKSTGVTPYGAIKANFQTQNLHEMSAYLPRKIKQKLRQWWAIAFKDVGNVEGSFSYVGDVDNKAMKNNRASLTGKATANDVVVNYGSKRNWPVFASKKVDLTLQNETLNFVADQGTVEELEAKGITAKITDLFSKTVLLRVDYGITGPVEYLADFLQTGPLIIQREGAPKPRKFVDVESGTFAGKLNLRIPLTNVRKTKVSGEIRLEDTELIVPSGMVVKDVNGDLEFTEDSVVAENLKANLLGGDALINVSTIEKGSPPSLRLLGAGRLDSQELSLWLGEAIASRIDGETDWSGYVDITKQGVKINAESALEGIEIALPTPFAKPANETQELALEFKSGSQLKNSLNISIGKEIELNFQALADKGGNLLDSGQIKVGNVRAISDEVAGVVIDVNHDAVNLDEWIDTITDISRVATKKTSNVSFVDQLRKIKINTQDLTLFSKQLGVVNIAATATDGKVWKTRVSGENVEGDLLLEPFNKPSKYTLNLERLLWPHTPKDKNAEYVEPPRLTSDDRKPNNWPIVVGSVQQLSALGKSLGKMDINASPLNDKWVINDFRLSRDGVNVIASGDWSRIENENLTETRLQIALNSSSAGDALQDLGFDELMTDGSVKFNSDIAWTGAPSDFHLSRLDGNYELDVRKGRFPKVDPKSGRFFGLLNVNNLTRRLRLDFKDVFGSGLEFDHMESSGFVAQGDLLLKSFFIYSSSVYVQANGMIGLAKENYDMQLLVSPQLGGNLALLSALTNPAAGAVVFLAQKVFKKQFDQALVYTYSIDGTWKKPIIERVTNK